MIFLFIVNINGLCLTVFTHWYVLMPWVGQCLGVSAWAFPLRKVYRFYYFYRCKVTTYMYNMQTFSTLFYFRHRKSPSPAPRPRGFPLPLWRGVNGLANYSRTVVSVPRPP